MSRSAYNKSYPEPDGRSGTHVPITASPGHYGLNRPHARVYNLYIIGNTTRALHSALVHLDENFHRISYPYTCGFFLSFLLRQHIDLSLVHTPISSCFFISSFPSISSIFSPFTQGPPLLAFQKKKTCSKSRKRTAVTVLMMCK